MGPFTQEDPIGLAGGLNLYGYAGGDPVNFSDPFGLCPCYAWVARWAGQRAGNLLLGRVLPAIGSLGRALIPGLRPGAEPGIDDFAGGAARAGVRLLEREGDTVVGAFNAAAGEGRFVAELVQEGSDLIMRGAHIEGDATLKEALGIAWRLGEEMGVDRVIIEGGKRTTGARAGHVPRPLIIEIRE